MRNLNINKMDIPSFYAELNGGGNSARACDFQGCGCVPNYVPKYTGNNQAKIERVIAMRKHGYYCKGEYRWFPQPHPNSFNPLWLGKNLYRTVEVDDWGREILEDRKYWYNDYDRFLQIPMYAHRRMKDKKRTIYRKRDRKRKNSFVRLFLNEI